MQFNLNGKVALVTGGGRGIGKNVSLMLAQNGADVALCGRTQETLDATAEEIRKFGRQAWPHGWRCSSCRASELARLVHCIQLPVRSRAAGAGGIRRAVRVASWHR